MRWVCNSPAAWVLLLFVDGCDAGMECVRACGGGAVNPQLVSDLEESIEAKVVYTDPAVSDVALKNAADVSGNIGLCDRGATYFDVGTFL